MARGNLSHRTQGYEVVDWTHPPVDDEEEDCVITASTPSVRRSSANINADSSKSEGVTVLIDNLEIGAQFTDVLKQLEQLRVDKEKIQWVVTLEPYRGMNHAQAHVRFQDRGSAEAAVGVLTKKVIVSSRGRPWVVTLGEPLQRANCHYGSGLNPTQSDLTVDDAGAGPSAGEFKVLKMFDPALIEYIAAKQRQRVFEEHRERIIRTMSQMQAREDQNWGPSIRTKMNEM
ncbi:unnamed protein product [Calypogeia fissa]